MKRWVGFGGLLFLALILVSTFIAPGTPRGNATAARVISNYHKHQAAYYASACVIVVGVIVGLAYFWYLREYLTRVPASRRLLTVAYAGVIVFAMSGTISAGLNFTLADGSHAGNIPGTAMQTLNLLNHDLVVPITAAGAGTFLLVTGLVVVRNGGLPTWLGWAAIVLGVIAATGFVGPAGVGLWVLAVSITTLVRGGKDVTTTAASPLAAA